MNAFPVTLRSTKASGRHAAAAEALAPGTTVCLEQATAFVVRTPFLDQMCHVCLAPLEVQMACQACRMVFYCSQGCVGKDVDHGDVCSALQHVQHIANATDVDPDLLRLMLMLAASRDSEDTRRTPFSCVNDLMSHREKANPAFVKVVTAAGERLLAEAPDLLHDLTADDLVTLACRINANAHGLGDNQSRNTDVALGLFPLGAMFFNHGCNPNTAFVGMDHGQLAFRTIRPVAKDEELIVSYIDLYDARDDRRQTLLDSKHFWCKCKRCSGAIEKSVDRLLQGVVCGKCVQDVYVVPATQMDDLIKGQSSISVAVAQLDKKEEGDAQATRWSCAKCGSDALSSAIASTIVHQQQQYAQAMALVQQRQYTKAKQHLYPLVHAAKQLHAMHTLRLNAAIPLMNCQRYEKDIKGAIDTNRFILDFFTQQAEQGGLPANTAEISDFWQNLGELYDMLASQHRDRAILEKKYRKEARAAFAQAIRIRAIVFGTSHPKTKALQSLASSH